MGSALTTVSTDASVLIILRDSCISSEIFWLLMVIRGAAEILKVVDHIHRLSSHVNILIILLLVLSSHLHVKSFL